MNIYVLFSLLLFLAPGGCPIYSIDLSTLELPNNFQNELTLQSMLNSEMHQYRKRLNSNANIDNEEHCERAEENPFEKDQLMQSIEDRIKATYNAAASPEEPKVIYSDDGTVVNNPIEPYKRVRSKCHDFNDFVGTNLFGNYPKKCFSADDIALMSARRDFEMLIPKSFPQTLLHDSIVYRLMKYFNSVNHVIRRMSDDETRNVLQRSFYDALGGYLRFYLLPVVQMSYYAGRLKLCTVQRLVALLRQCRTVLNTNGNGWKQPVHNILKQLHSVDIRPIRMNEHQNSECDAASCALLDQNCDSGDDQKEQMIVPLPHLELEDGEGFLGNIFLPFRHRRIYNLRSIDSAFILVKFYKTLLHCYRFQGVSPETYNNKLRKWILENLQAHYRDEVFYPGLGGVLQIYEALITLIPCSDQKISEEDISEDDTHKDYSLTFDDEDSNVHRNIFYPNKNNPYQRFHKNQKPIVASRKKGRSANQTEANQIGDKLDEGEDGEKTSDRSLDGDGGKRSSDEAECVDCDDENFVGYIAAVLALLLLVLLLIIFCCLQKRKQTQAQNEKQKAAKQKEEEKAAEDVEAAPPPTPQKKEPSCWEKLFGKSKRNKGGGGGVSKIVPSHRRMRTSGGLSLIGSQLNEINPTAQKHTKIENMDRLMSRKREGTIFEEQSITSTSSLGYQFHRKFIPLKCNREKRDDYYARNDKRRSKAIGMPPSSMGQLEQDHRDRVRHRERDRERERDRDRDRDREREREREREKDRDRDRERERDRDHRTVIKLPVVCEDHTEKKETEERLLREPMRQTGKHRRQEGGLSHTNEVEMKPSNDVSKSADYTRSKEYTDMSGDRDNDRERRSQDTNINLTTEVTSSELTKPEMQPEYQENTSQSKSSGPLESNKYAASWETTFDDDSK